MIYFVLRHSDGQIKIGWTSGDPGRMGQSKWG